MTTTRNTEFWVDMVKALTSHATLDERGLTLFELATSILLTSLIAASATYSMHSMMRGRELRATSHELARFLDVVAFRAASLHQQIEVLISPTSPHEVTAVSIAPNSIAPNSIEDPFGEDAFGGDSSGANSPTRGRRTAQLPRPRPPQVGNGGPESPRPENRVVMRMRLPPGVSYEAHFTASRAGPIYYPSGVSSPGRIEIVDDSGSRCRITQALRGNRRTECFD